MRVRGHSCHAMHAPACTCWPQDFLPLYLAKKFPARLVTEMAYNLLYALNVHSYDPDCALFVKVHPGMQHRALALTTS